MGAKYDSILGEIRERDNVWQKINNNAIFEDGNVGIGTGSPFFKLDVSVAQTNVLRMTNTLPSSLVRGAGLQTYHDDGSAMASGDRLGFYSFGGNNGSTLSNSAIIAVFAEDNWTIQSTPAYMCIEVMPSGGIGPQDRTKIFRINISGLMPESNNIFDLGNITNSWRNIYSRNYYISGVQGFTGVIPTGSNILVSGGIIVGISSP